MDSAYCSLDFPSAKPKASEAFHALEQGIQGPFDGQRLGKLLL